MKSHQLKMLLAWLGLICFGLNTTVLSGGLVMCSNDRGGRIELGCERNEHGQCIDACCSDDVPLDESAPVRPCQDTPLQGDHHVPKMTARPTVMPVLALVQLVAILPSIEMVAPAQVRPRISIARDHPPDSLGRIRTIVLLV